MIKAVEAINIAKAEEKAWKELTGITLEMLGSRPEPAWQKEINDAEWGGFPIMEGVQAEKAPIVLGYDLGESDTTGIQLFKNGKLISHISLDPIPSSLHFVHSDGDEEDVDATEIGDLAIYRGPRRFHILHLPTWTDFDSAIPKPNVHQLEALINWCKAVQSVCLEEWAVLRALTPDNYNGDGTGESVKIAKVKQIIQELCLGTEVK